MWDSEAVSLLNADAKLKAVTLLEELERRDPGLWDSSVRLWCAQFGAKPDIYFAEETPPGRQGLLDFTVADTLKVEVEGHVPHRLLEVISVCCVLDSG